MAVRKATFSNIGRPVDSLGAMIPIVTANQQVRVTWTGLLNADTGSIEPMGFMPDKSVQVFGTFGAAGSIQIEGSNDAGVTWFTLRDPRGGTNTLVFTANGGQEILENTGHIRPNVTGGDGTTSLTVILVGTVPTS